MATVSDELVDRVAQSIRGAQLERACSWGDADDGAREEYRVLARAAIESLSTPEVTAERDALLKQARSPITSYAQIEAIYEAMRNLESEKACLLYANDEPIEGYFSDKADACLAKIRAALAGEKASDDGSP